MSALGQKQTCAVQLRRSALPPEADIDRRSAPRMSAKGPMISFDAMRGILIERKIHQAMKGSGRKIMVSDTATVRARFFSVL